MNFSLIKKLSGSRYEAFERPATPEHKFFKFADAKASGSKSSQGSDASSPTQSSEPVDMISFSDDEDNTGSDSLGSTGTRKTHERTLSNESVASQCVTEQWADVLAPKQLRPSRKAPGLPETMETHLKRLSPAAFEPAELFEQRDSVARQILAHAAKEWVRQYPAPVTLERMSVQSLKHVSMSDDALGSNAFSCIRGLVGSQEAAKQYWAAAVNAVLEVYITPRPNPEVTGRSAYYPQARKTIAREHPGLQKALQAIEANDFSQQSGHLLGLLAGLKS